MIIYYNKGESDLHFYLEAINQYLPARSYRRTPDWYNFEWRTSLALNVDVNVLVTHKGSAYFTPYGGIYYPNRAEVYL